MQLSRVWGLRSWVVVKSGGQNMANCTASPTISFFGGEGISVVGFNITPLGFTEPEVVTLKEGI